MQYHFIEQTGNSLELESLDSNQVERENRELLFWSIFSFCSSLFPIPDRTDVFFK